MTKRHYEVYLASRLTLICLSGLASYLAFPRPGIWPVIFLVVAGFQVALSKTTYPRAILLGLAGGFCFFASQCWWISQYLGPEPLIALSTLEALFVAAAAVVFVYLERHLKSRLLIAVCFASVWAGREWFSTHFPYGGFPWSRLAMSQGFSPLTGWVYFGGMSLLSFVIALTSSLAVLYARDLVKLNRKALIWSVAVLAALFVVPTLAVAQKPIGHLTVAGIQGNANAGLFANNVPGEVLNNHLAVTQKLIDSGTGKTAQLVIWPENASDINPQDSAIVADRINTLVDKKLGVPLLFGTLTENAGRAYNSTLLWQPGRGITDQYDKKRPVPFAEFVPDRPFWNALAPQLIGLIYRGFSPGTRDPIYEVDSYRLGDLICFEIAIDDIITDIADHGANAIVSQSNNADFGHSDESYQQFAMMRIRAIETGLPVINVSTTGPSGAFDANGNSLGYVDAFRAKFFVSRLPMQNATTPAMGIGRYFDILNLALLGAGVILVEFRRIRSRASQRRDEI